MISIKIHDINNFMTQLLTNELFDSFLLCDGEISTTNSFTINGRINKSFFAEDESMNLENFIYWKQLKHICFEIIKGKKVPTKMKFVFSAPSTHYEKFISESGAPFTLENIGGLYLHIYFENNEITCITGTSLNTFSMDKTLDNYWDDKMLNFLCTNFQCEKE